MTRSLVLLATVGPWCLAGAFVACSDSGESAPPPPADAAADARTPPEAAAPDTAVDAPPPGDTGADARPPDDLGPMATYCAQLATATCDRRAHCTGRADPACVPDTNALCRKYARAQIVDALDAGVLAFDPAKAATCFASPFDDFCQPGAFAGLEACQGVFTGTIALGKPCLRVYMFGDVDECKDGRCSAGEVFGACVPGTCQAFLAAGAACACASVCTVP